MEVEFLGMDGMAGKRGNGGKAGKFWKIWKSVFLNYLTSRNMG